MRPFGLLLLAAAGIVWGTAAQAAEARVIDVPTRAGVTQRFLLLAPEKPKAAVILFAGGHGGLQIQPDGKFKWGGGNFLVRTRERFVEQGLMVAVIDAPSDRQNSPYLSGMRQTAAHVTDVKAVIAWLRQQARVPVWLIGTSRGTQSVAYVATQLVGSDGGPDGVVLTATILTDPKSTAVPDMDVQRLRIPVLVAHHRRDGCSHCAYGETARLMNRLTAAARKELLSFDGGFSEGDPCEARAYHGFNGIEHEVVSRIAAWITAP